MDVSHLMFAASVMLIATAIAVGVAKKLELGSIVALLIVGVLLGPHSPKPLFSGHVDEMQAIGEIGVLLLLFAIGLELQPAKLWSMRSLVFRLGTAQYLLTTAAILAFFAVIFGGGAQWRSMLVVSLGLALSSAAIPFPILEERSETKTLQGRAVIAIDIFQGFMVIPVLALIPLLGANGGTGDGALDVAKIPEVIAAIVGVYLLGRYLVPWALRLTARRLGPSGFVVIVLGAVFFAGWWMDAAGISAALGTFMMGVLLSTTVSTEQIKAAVEPAKRLLLAIFFIAIGMAIDLAQVLELKADLLLFLPALLSIKFVILFGLALLFRFDLRSALLTGLLMMPFDEIAYVVLANANANNLLSARYYTVGITVISFSFIVSPLLINLGYKLTARLNVHRPSTESPVSIAEASVVVAGYGPVGRAICAMLERASVPYTAFDADPDCVADAKRTRHNVHYGDLVNAEMMRAVALARARLLVVAMNEFPATKQMIGNLRRFFPSVPVMVAVQYLAQRDELRDLGAVDVVALSPEGALKFGHVVLERLGIGLDQADAIVNGLKTGDYAALRAVARRDPLVASEGAR